MKTEADNTEDEGGGWAGLKDIVKKIQDLLKNVLKMEFTTFKEEIKK